MKTSYQYICENQGIAKEVFKRIKPYLSKSNIEQTNKTGWNRSGKKDEVMIGLQSVISKYGGMNMVLPVPIFPFVWI